MIVYLLIFFLFLLVALYIFWRFNYFYRDPDRSVPEGDEKIVSPADGTVIYTKKVVRGGEFFSTKKGRKIDLKTFCADSGIEASGTLVGIFMHPTSVHVNRAPISGKVGRICYKAGQNLPMTITWWRTNFGLRPFEKYADHIISNERNIISIDGKIKVFIIQIADIYVNKIECWVREKDRVTRGQRIGMIKMGSQVDVFLPTGVDVKIGIGDKVKAGETIIGEL